MKKIGLGLVVGILLVALAIIPASASTGPSAPAQLDSSPLVIKQGVDKLVGRWYGFDVYLSYRTCMLLGTIGSAGSFGTILGAALGAWTPIIGWTLLGMSGAIWAAAGAFQAGVRIRFFTRLGPAICIGIASQ